jgi:hypothetical protein
VDDFGRWCDDDERWMGRDGESVCVREREREKTTEGGTVKRKLRLSRVEIKSQGSWTDLDFKAGRVRSGSG